MTCHFSGVNNALFGSLYLHVFDSSDGGGLRFTLVRQGVERAFDKQQTHIPPSSA
jgi:hypothetical protein